MNFFSFHELSSLRKGQRIFAAIFACLVLFGGLAGCGRGRGKAAVEEMCKKDGGLRIHETVNVRGFLDEDTSSTLSAGYLKDRRFEYVDIAVLGKNPESLYGSEGYFRLSRAKQGDLRCNAYSEEAARHVRPNVQSKYGFEPDECLAIKKLLERPKGMVLYKEPFRQVKASNGQLLGVETHTIKNEVSGEILATRREYIFTSDWTIALDMGGSGGRRDGDCHSVAGIEDSYRIPSLLVERALLDRSKILQ